MNIGRLSCWPFTFAVLVSFLGLVLLAVIADFVDPSSAQSSIMGMLFCLLFVWFVVLMIARLHDIGHAGWWWPLVVAPAGIGLVALAVFPGAKDANKYGNTPSGTLRDLLTFYNFSAKRSHLALLIAAILMLGSLYYVYGDEIFDLAGWLIPIAIVGLIAYAIKNWGK